MLNRKVRQGLRYQKLSAAGRAATAAAESHRRERPIRRKSRRRIVPEEKPEELLMLNRKVRQRLRFQKLSAAGRKATARGRKPAPRSI